MAECVRDEDHPAKEELQRLMRGELIPADAKVVVRHLLTRCPTCTRETRRLWSFGEPKHRQASASTTPFPRSAGVWG